MTRRLRAGEIHVLVVWLSPRLRPGTLLRGLSRVERKVARTFMNVQAMTEYIASRFCLRLLASKYLGVGPYDFELHKTATGQPQLVSLRGASPHHLHISLSHCVRGIAIAVAHKTRIGVDLETHRRPPAATEAVARWLIGAERTLVGSRQIFDCWTRKEALLKGLGLGLSGLASVPPLEHRTNVATAGATVWTVDSLSVAPDCSLACAADRVQRRIRLFAFRSCTTINRNF
jgi:4'-phosphopantetheinyl transferase